MLTSLGAPSPDATRQQANTAPQKSVTYARRPSFRFRGFQRPKIHAEKKCCVAQQVSKRQLVAQLGIQLKPHNVCAHTGCSFASAPEAKRAHSSGLAPIPSVYLKFGVRAGQRTKPKMQTPGTPIGAAQHRKREPTPCQKAWPMYPRPTS